MFNLIQNLFDLLSSLVDFIVDFFGDLVYVATLLPQMVSNATQVLTIFIPGPVLALVLAMITLSVVYKVLGRD